MVNFWTTGTEIAASEEEKRRWLKRLPKGPELELLNSYFPVQSAATRPPRDSASRPFGCLTENGLESMRNLGRSIKKLHPRILEKGAQEGQDDKTGDGGALPVVQFYVFSSNFSRTQQSAQGLLHGLGAHELARGDQVPVVVREEKACTIHMYDNNPRMIQEEVGKVLTAPSFVARQDQQEALKSDLVRLIPRLNSDNFKWMEAADFFWCWPQDLDMPGPLKRLRQPTVEYVAWRFQQYYAHPPLLALVIAPLVQEILGTLRRMGQADSFASNSDNESSGSSQACRVAVFSGHDVTLLAFLHALDWPLAHNPAWWPPYGCALVFELLEPFVPDAGGKGGEYRVRIRLDMTGKSYPLSLPLFTCSASSLTFTDDDDGLPLSELEQWLHQHGPRIPEDRA
ncbi:histidine acid [Nannochloropsis oceanica]